MYILIVNDNKNRIEDMFKYKYIFSLPLYWSNFIKIENWNNGTYIFRYIKNKNEIKAFKNEIWENYIYDNIFVLKYSAINTKYPTYSEFLLKGWILKDEWWYILPTEKWKKYLLTKEEIFELLKWWIEK